MQQQKTIQAEEFCLGRSRHKMQRVPVKMDTLYEKTFDSQEKDWTCGYALNITAWD